MYTLPNKDFLPSFLQARAPSATLLFISSKIRAKKNNTTAYISSHAEAEALVMKSVTVAAKLKRSSQKSVVEQQKELSERIADKMQKKQEGERRKMGKNLKELMGSTDPDYAAAFPSLEKLIPGVAHGYCGWDCCWQESSENCVVTL